MQCDVTTPPHFLFIRMPSASSPRTSAADLIVQSRIMKVLAIISFVLMSATIALPQTKQPVTNLCSLEGTLAQGGTLSVVVAGVHEGGPGKRGTALGI